MPTATRKKPEKMPGGRAPQLTDWLTFIRPHAERYRELPRGQQKQFVENLEKKTGRSVNTLRRYIAAAEFLEGHGVTAWPDGVKTFPVAAVEAIARASRKDFAAGRELIEELLRGEGSIRGAKVGAERAMRKRRAKPLHDTREARDAALIAEVRAFAATLKGAADWLSSELSVTSPLSWDGPLQIFHKAAAPYMWVPFPGAPGAIIFDERKLKPSGQAEAHKLLPINVVAATAYFDCVLVYCEDMLKYFVEMTLKSMNDVSKAKIWIVDIAAQNETS